MSTSETPTETTEAVADESKKLSLEVEIEKPSACERHISVSIARDDVDRYLDEAFDELMPKAEVPGFRAGTASDFGPGQRVHPDGRHQPGDR